MSVPLGDKRQLRTRLTASVAEAKPVTFLFGSAISAGTTGSSVNGVPNAHAMVQRALGKFSPEEQVHLQAALTGKSMGAAYQETMQHLVNSYGQASLNDLVRDAVIASLVRPAAGSARELEGDVSLWGLPPAAAASGVLIAKWPATFSRAILTSNFDPLLEVAIRKGGRQAHAIFLSSDGRFDNVVAPDSAPVVHLHGYWDGSDTLHTPAQLRKPRPQLAGCLRDLLRDTTLVVMGYGGWDDVFTTALFSLIRERSTSFDILWCFLSSAIEDIHREHSQMLNEVADSVGSRFLLYGGIDCHEFLPDLSNLLRGTASVPIASTAASVPHGPPPAISALDVADHPPETDVWVGREAELSLLAMNTSTVVAITGLGGQGKSALAAKYLEQKQGFVEFWDWRDCKEETNTFVTQIVQIIKRLKGSDVDLRGESDDFILESFFEVLGPRRGVLVFDNTDQYVDIESGLLVGMPGALVTRALKRGHRAQFVFTCRPKVDYAAVNFMPIELSGFDEATTTELLKAKGVSLDDSDPQTAPRVRRLISLTKGHPLWLNLIAKQVYVKHISLDKLLDNIELGHDPMLPRNLLREILASLTDKQVLVLRYMAELIYPESEEQLAEFARGDINYHQLRKAIRVLRSLDLIVVKRAQSVETLELHPLVREYIRQEFPRPERESFITSILTVVNRLIARVTQRFGDDLSFDHTRYARSKVELCLHVGRCADAAAALAQLAKHLLRSGHSEEFARLAESVIAAEDVTSTGGLDERTRDALLTDLAKTLSELGRFDEADNYLKMLEASIAGKTARYINLCNQRCYALWCRKDFVGAIEWGRRGQDLKISASLDTQYDCRHNLALATRDAGNVQDALDVFLGGNSLADVLEGRVSDEQRKNGPFWGNIGRCLQLQGRLDDALIVLVRSARILEAERSSWSLVNRGWAALWLAEVCEARTDYDRAFICFVVARETFQACSPPRSRRAAEGVDRVAAASIPRVDDPDRVMRLYSDWLAAFS